MNIALETEIGAQPPQILSLARFAKAAFMLSGASLVCCAIIAAPSANAQAMPGYANQFQIGYGTNGTWDMMTPYDARTRDLNANRVVIDGIIMTGDDLSSLPLSLVNSNSGMGYAGITGYAIGNQLNVTTTGSFNTVVVNSSQVNNGNQTVIVNGAACAGTCPTTTGESAEQILNGGLNF